MTAARGTLAMLAAAAVAMGLSALTRVPYATHADGAVLRLSWRVRGEEIERCRRATAAELANLPAHMRQDVICDQRRVAPYRLRALVDGRAAVDERAAGSDVAGDRPMYLLRDLPLGSGPHRIAVLLERLGEGSAVADTLDSRARRRRAIPPRLALDTTIQTDPQSIALVTYDAELRQLVLLSSAAAAPRAAR